MLEPYCGKIFCTGGLPDAPNALDDAPGDDRGDVRGDVLGKSAGILPDAALGGPPHTTTILGGASGEASSRRERSIACSSFISLTISMLFSAISAALRVLVSRSSRCSRLSSKGGLRQGPLRFAGGISCSLPQHWILCGRRKQQHPAAQGAGGLPAAQSCAQAAQAACPDQKCAH